MCPEGRAGYINPTGNFVIGGPDGDCGLTGRKIIVDTYGGAAPHGGGAFSGKDPTKVDRSGRLRLRATWPRTSWRRASPTAARCRSATPSASPEPLSVYVELHGNPYDVEEAKLEATLRELMNLRPRGIREHLKMNRPIYAVTSAYGHFGREPDPTKDNFTWEKTDLVPALKSAFGR